MRLIILSLVFLCAARSIALADSINYSAYDQVLTEYVDGQGRVDYQGLLNNRAAFDQFIAAVEQVSLDGMTAVEQKTFWINAYNAITLNVILKYYPVKSIRRINFGFVWNIPRKVTGTKKSLWDIEHKILRPLGDPRIHFAINCASIGCPNLPARPFVPEQLDAQLEREAKRFINDPRKVRLESATDTLYHSAIFDWFKKDFLVEEASLLDYIKRYINDADRAYLDSHDVRLKILKYDWGLNTQ